MKWLGSIDQITEHQTMYSLAVEKLAAEEQVPLVDIRAAFLRHGNIPDLICEDGTHPNSMGQKVITEAFQQFAAERQNILLLPA